MTIEIPDDANWVTDSQLKDRHNPSAIVVDKVQYSVPYMVVILLDKLQNDVRMWKRQAEIQESANLKILKRQNEESDNKESLYLAISQVLRYGKSAISPAQETKAFATEMRVQWEMEVKQGMTGWIQANWGKLCHLTCNCGNLVSYDVLRESNTLQCKECFQKEGK